MRRGTWLQACIGASALALAGSAAAQGRGPGPFAGSFSVASNTTVSVTSPMAITEERTTRERLEIGQGTRADMNIQVSNDLGERCTLTANRSGDASLSFGSGQRCTFTDSVRNMRMNFTLRSGSGTISGNRLSLTFNWSVASNGGFLSVSGSASQRTSGNRTGGRAMADTGSVPLDGTAPMVPVGPSFPAAVVPVTEPMGAPMMPMTGTPPRTPRRSTTTTARPRAAAPGSAVAVLPPPPVAVSPAPVIAPSTAPASAWGSPSPAVQPSPVASSWTTPSAPNGGGRVPLPIDATTPGAIVHSSGWILGPLFSTLAAAAPLAMEAANAWSNQIPTNGPSSGATWGGSNNTPGAAWAPTAGSPGVVLGGTDAAPSQGFGVAVGRSPSRPVTTQAVPPSGGPGIVFGATR